MSTITLSELGSELNKIVAEIDEKMFAFCARNFQQEMQGVVIKMRQPGMPITYPVKWASQKQRRAFFARDGFSKPAGWKRPKGYVNKNIPTQRTGRYNKGWELVEKRDDSQFKATANGTLKLSFTIQNYAPYYQFVGGDINGVGQSPIHKGRWKTLESVLQQSLNDWMRTLPSRLSTVKLLDKK